MHLAHHSTYSLVSIGMCMSPGRCPSGSRNEIGWQIFDGVVIVRSIGIQGSDGLKMYEDIGIELSIEWKGTSMYDRMTFIQHHISRFHRHIGRLAVVTVHLQRPWFVDVLIDIDNGRCDQRKSINTVEKLNTKFGSRLL